MQASLAEFHSDFDCENPGEPTESDDRACEIAQRDGTRDDLDYSLTVFVSENGSHYHAEQYGICACPHINGEKITLGEAVKRGYLPCNVCGPVKVHKQDVERLL